MLERHKKKRRLSLIITILDFIIIIIVIFFINMYLFKTKSIEYENFRVKYKYDKLRDNMGYIFSLKIENISPEEKEIKKDNNVYFYIENKKGTLIWEKHSPRPTLPMGQVEKKVILLKPDDILSYTYIYDFQNEVKLGKGEWRFGARITLGTNQLNISIPRSTKPRKGIFDFFR